MYQHFYLVITIQMLYPQGRVTSITIFQGLHRPFAYVYSPKEVTDCCRYYRDFHLQLPIMDPSIPADDLYGYSPLLFWVVLSIGSRKYAKHPTLIHALSPRVTNQIMMSMNPKSIPIDLVKALVLFLTWPFPSHTFLRTSSFVLGATLIHMAMQCGLHTPFLSIEASKLYLEHPEMSSLEKAKLWAYVVITYQQYVTTLNAKLYLQIGTNEFLMLGYARFQGSQL
jgi:hypothetical protein